jgi:hypothetical protein
MRITNLPDVLYSEYLDLVAHIHGLGGLHSSEVPLDLVQQAVSVIGAVDPSQIAETKSDIVAPNQFVDRNAPSIGDVSIAVALIGMLGTTERCAWSRLDGLLSQA